MINTVNSGDTPNSNVKSSSLSFSIKKCKDGTGDNWSVEPGAPPFYLMSHECPVTEAKESGSKNLLHLHNLESAYQKFCVKRLKEDLSAFLPNVCGKVNVPASEDGSGLIDLLQRPPVGGKDLMPFNQSQLDHAFRLHPGPLPQEYLNLFLNVNNNEVANSSTENSPQYYLNTPNPGTGKKRRRDSHKNNSIIISSNNPSSASSQQISTQQQHHTQDSNLPQQTHNSHNQQLHDNPPGLIPANNSSITSSSGHDQNNSIKRSNTIPNIPGTNLSSNSYGQNIPLNPPPLNHNFNNVPQTQSFPPNPSIVAKQSIPSASNQSEDAIYGNISDDEKRKKKRKEKKKKKDREAF